MNMQDEAMNAIADLGSAEQMEYETMSPTGQFSKGAMNSLVSAFNKVGALFELDNYSNFTEDQTQFPGDFTRQLTMISGAVDDAIKNEVLTPDMAISLDGVTSDKDLAMLAGKLNMIAKSKDFRKFLAEAPEEEVSGTNEMETEQTMEPSEKDLDQLMMSRM